MELGASYSPKGNKKLCLLFGIKDKDGIPERPAAKCYLHVSLSSLLIMKTSIPLFPNPQSIHSNPLVSNSLPVTLVEECLSHANFNLSTGVSSISFVLSRTCLKQNLPFPTASPCFPLLDLSLQYKHAFGISPTSKQITLSFFSHQTRLFHSLRQDNTSRTCQYL